MRGTCPDNRLTDDYFENSRPLLIGILKFVSQNPYHAWYFSFHNALTFKAEHLRSSIYGWLLHNRYATSTLLCDLLYEIELRNDLLLSKNAIRIATRILIV